jgi:PPOX class probable F420-dependent enzyme
MFTTKGGSSLTVSLTPGVRKLFTDANYGHLATLMKDGSPQVTTVWLDLDGDRILVNTAEGRVKPRNIRRDPRVAISVSDPSGYPSATIRGRVVEVTNEGAADHIDKLAKKYLEQDMYPWAQPGDVRVHFVVQPEHVSGMMTD